MSTRGTSFNLPDGCKPIGTSVNEIHTSPGAKKTAATKADLKARRAADWGKWDTATKAKTAEDKKWRGRAKRLSGKTPSPTPSGDRPPSPTPSGDRPPSPEPKSEVIVTTGTYDIETDERILSPAEQKAAKIEADRPLTMDEVVTRREISETKDKAAAATKKRAAIARTVGKVLLAVAMLGLFAAAVGMTGGFHHAPHLGNMPLDVTAGGAALAGIGGAALWKKGRNMDSKLDKQEEARHEKETSDSQESRKERSHKAWKQENAAINAEWEAEHLKSDEARFEKAETAKVARDAENATAFNELRAARVHDQNLIRELKTAVKEGQLSKAEAKIRLKQERKLEKIEGKEGASTYKTASGTKFEKKTYISTKSGKSFTKWSYFNEASKRIMLQKKLNEVGGDTDSMG